MARPRTPFVTPLPVGVPTYSSRHGCCAWDGRLRPIPEQFHSDWDIFWVRRGTVEVRLKDRIRYRGGRDDFLILPPFTKTVVREVRPRLRYWYCHFCFRLPPQHPRLFLEDLRTLDEDFEGPGQRALVPLAFSRREAPAVWRAFRHLARLRPDGQGPPWRVERALIALVAALADFARRRTAAGRPGRMVDPLREQDARVMAVCRQIDDNSSFRWRVATLARSVGLSPGRLHGLCRRTLDKSLKAYIVEARLRQALQMLRETSGSRRRPSIKEISAACGFSSQHFFCRQFKSAYHVPPSAAAARL